MSFVTRMRRRALSERGEADPMLTIAAIAVSTIIAATLIGVLTLVIQSGSNIVTENLRSTNAALAQKLWSQDANNASLAVQRDASEVSFYEIPGRLPGVYVQRDSTPLAYCRKSTWTVEDGQVQNRVEQFENDVCDLDDPLLAADRETVVLTLDGLVEGDGIVSENAAGRDLHFVEFEEIGLAVNSPTPSVNDRSSWWRDYEWEYDQPRRINLDTQLDLPLSGVVDGTLRGTTNIASTRAGDTLDNAEDNPNVTPFDPDALANLQVVRSTTTGEVFAGVREGVRISFDGVTCGPFSAEYTVTYTPTTPGVAEQQQVFTAFGAPAAVEMAEVPNGAAGTVTVEAACPSSVSTIRPMIETPYVQELPTPALAATIGATPNLHELSWTRVSSLPVEYTVDERRGSGAWAPQAVTENPTTDVAADLEWPLGSTYGVQHRYRVTAEIDGRTAGPSNEELLFTAWPAVAPPTVTDGGSGNSRTVTSTAVACPPGTDGQYRFRVQLNSGPWGAWTAWSTARTHTFLVAEGQRYDFEAEARCSYSPEQSSPPSPPGTTDHVHPIVTAPNPPTATVANPAAPETDPNITRNVTGCPANTTAEFQMRVSINGGAFTAWSPWSATRTVPHAIRVGQQAVIQLRARCVTEHSTGPQSPDSSTTWVRPIPAPAAPTNVRNDAGGVSGPKNDRVLWNAVTCPAGTTPRYRWQNASSGVYGAYGTGLTVNVGTSWGTSYSFRAQARCVSAYADSPGSSLSATTNWTTNIPTPARPTVSAPTSAYVNRYFTVSGSGASCPAGTTIAWDTYNSGSSTRWSSASFSDYWPTTGTRTYYMRARCYTAAASSAWSAYGSDSIRIDQVPAPSAPGGASATWSQGSRGGGTVQGRFSAVSGATSYTSEARFQWNTFWELNWRTATVYSSGTVNHAACGETRTMTQGAWRVRANNAGGSSGYAAPATSRASFSSCG